MLQTITDIYQTNPKEFHRFFKFSIVGTIGAVIDFTLLNLALYFIRTILHWEALRLLAIGPFTINGHLLIANTFSVSVAILSNFIWNRLWTFPESRTRKKRVQLPQFATVNLIGLFLNNLIVISADAFIFAQFGEPLSYNLAKVVAIGIVLFWNFGANRFWTYRGL